MRSLFTAMLPMLVLMASCTSRQVYHQLQDVESYIQECPDSALSVLEGMDTTSLKGRKNRAYHALLHVMALDKNYFNVTDDSLARTALNYFDRHGQKKYKARALYYLGLSKYYSKQYSDAIIPYTQAEDVARECSDSLYIAFSLVGQADVYNQIYNDSEEIKCLNEAISIFDDLSMKYYGYAAKSQLAQAYIGSYDFELSEQILKELLDIKEYEDLYAMTACRYAYLQMVKEDLNPELSAEYYAMINDQYSGRYMTIRDYWAWATSLDMIGESELSNILISELTDSDTSFVSNYWQYLIAKDNKDINKAFFYLEKTFNEGDNEIESALRQSLARYQRDYYQSFAFLEAHKSEKRLYIILLVVISTICISIISLWRINKISREKASIIEFAEEISKLASEEQTRNNSLKKKYISLYQSKFDMIRSLCYQYFISQNRIDAEKLMYDKIAYLINDLRKDEHHRVNLERILDKDLDGIMSNLRCEMPKLKEIDYTLYAYFITGFNTTVISQMTGVSEGNIYARKRRLRLKIQESSPLHKEQFLEMLT